MPRSSRTKAAATRASFGRAERLQREATDGRPAKSGPARKQPNAARALQKDTGRERTERLADKAVTRAAARDRKLTALDIAMARAERTRDASEKRHQHRLRQQTRGAFNSQAERRRDADRRVEHDRKREALQVKVRRVEDSRRKTAQRVAERKREDMRRSFSRAAENRKALDAAARQKELERRATVQIERDQKRQAADHQAAQRRQTDAMRTRHGIARDSYRDNETMAMERHHNRIKGIDAREDRELGDFDGRRRGLAGRMAELVPGKRAENDRQREEMKRGFEIERQTQHHDYEAVKERQFEVAQRGRLQQAQERKALMELHRDERAAFGRSQADDRPRLIEQRAHVLERADRAHEQQREHARAELGRESARENVRPAGDFARAASDHGRELAAAGREFRQEGREMVRPSQAFGQA